MTMLQSASKPLLASLICSVLEEILLHSSKIPELSRQISSGVIPSLVPCFLTLSTKMNSCKLSGLKVTLSCFHGACGPFRGKIEKMLVPFLSGSQPRLSQSACECYALLSMCGGAGLQGVKHAQNWAELLDKLLGSMDVALTDLCGSYETILEQHHQPTTSLNFEPVNPVDPERTLQLTGRVKTLARAILAMLNMDFSAAVNVPVDDILHWVCRVLHMTPRPLVCSAPLSAGSNLMCFADTINGLLIQTLTWGLREQVYCTIEVWLSTLGACADMESSATDLIQYIRDDIQPQMDTLQLMTKAGSSLQSIQSQFSQKKKRKHAASGTATGDPQQMTSQSKIDPSANAAVCHAALRVLKALLDSHGPLLTAQQLRSVHAVVISHLLLVQSKDLPLPYTHASCRLALYEVLFGCVQCVHHQWAPPIHCALPILHHAILDPHKQIVSACKAMLAACEGLVHPRAPSLAVASTDALQCSSIEPLSSVNHQDPSASRAPQLNDANLKDLWDMQPNKKPRIEKEIEEVVDEEEEEEVVDSEEEEEEQPVEISDEEAQEIIEVYSTDEAPSTDIVINGQKQEADESGEEGKREEDEILEETEDKIPEDKIPSAVEEMMLDFNDADADS
ncbi:hypothetical protein CAPTEDRAFT_219987 [Capitella teleta]|uniref:Pre-rRNA-processing protein RIX1 N-terminal domain-containing protein n=1 Tax=Capitella teleta TaxID=283909 RepID=R7TRU7_CAPTE|nr:hypothetical protein CAPTEDRAFT_219987 [Capitella teleta]|eukprot:ELT96349.1 hypothetical protein CAPTEDRAFT_219987 [Capitella teleta]